MVVLIATLFLLLPSLATSTDLFPIVNVTFENEMQHAVDLMCNFEPEQRITTLMPGELVWWTVEDILFPAVWCYLQVTDDFFGMFWGYLVTKNCGTLCRWRIKEDGVYYVQSKDGALQYQWLYQIPGGGFV
ncbi:unnamed protein product [Linum tenue]|uniref:S-protein homolog n=2 Tax=Linum tenue TaxID=586396 RepID=A0AAV0K7R1_9ROSI|nr:unnamed protein product [Linum tenue]